MKLISRGVFAVIIVLGTMLCPMTAVGQTPDSERIPSTVEECEGQGQARLCSTWKWTGKGLEGTWPDGSIGYMTIGFFEVGHNVMISFARADKTGNLAGVGGVYWCEVHKGKIVDGKFFRTVGGVTTIVPWGGTVVYGPIDDQRQQR